MAQEQTFLRYVLTDAGFIASGTLASARSLVAPATMVGVGVALVAAPPAGLFVLVAMALFVAVDWVLLVLRMARRIALGAEDPNDLLERGVLENASVIYETYYARRVA